MSEAETWLDRAAAARLAESAEGCCANDAWRGHFCSYHQGYEDGLDAAIAIVENMLGITR